jgi:S-methyl-5-thioribose-1-phosphate isomerase
VKVLEGGRARDLRAVWMERDGSISLIDQRKLPGALELVSARTTRQVAEAIRDMAVRGAPAIGATAALGVAQAALKKGDLRKAAALLKAARPTANDLAFAVDHMVAEIEAGADPRRAAESYVDSIVDRCRKIGTFGAPLIKDHSKVLTHCNAGALATVDYGTALAPMRVAHEQGRDFFVWVDETRPRLQGAKLTAWELLNEGIAHAVIADNAAGHYFQRGEVDLVITGADRIVANGDFANKIGTYEKAVLAREHGVPFYVAAPISTFDFTMESGRSIPIEERSEEEVTLVGGERLAPEGSAARNPAFDVTPSKFVKGFITEVGVLRPSEVSKVSAAAIPRARAGTRFRKRT